ncbi:MAG: transketolase family protein [Candidatus Bathyarchaeia archaeon]
MSTIRVATRDAYGKTLVELGRTNKDIVALDADLAESTRSAWFGHEFPDRFFDVGIAEENLITVAAGLATCGKIPFANTFAVFATERAYNQIRQVVAYTSLNVKIVASHGGVTVGEDGTSHHGIFDIALMRILPNMTVVVPADGTETVMATRAIAAHVGPVYMRTGRAAVPLIYEEGFKLGGKQLEFKLGKAVTIKEGKDMTIVATGLMVSEALSAVELLSKEGISAGLIDMHTIKPLDVEAICSAAQTTGAIVTAEEHTVIGGLGSAVAEALSQRVPVPIEMVGIKDVFTESGSASELLKKYGLTAFDIASAAKAVLRRKK